MAKRPIRQKLATVAKWFSALAIAAVIGVGAVVGGEPYVPQHHNIFADPGGNVWERYEEFAREGSRGDTFRVDGLCASACTMLLGAVPASQVCATPQARFGFHAASTFMPSEGLGLRVFSKDGTQTLWAIYPKKVQQALIGKGWTGPDTDQKTLIWFKGDELGVRPCE